MLVGSVLVLILGLARLLASKRLLVSPCLDTLCLAIAIIGVIPRPMIVFLVSPNPVLGVLIPLAPRGILALGGVVLTLGLLRLLSIPPVGSAYNLVMLGFCTSPRGIPIGLYPKFSSIWFACLLLILLLLVCMFLNENSACLALPVLVVPYVIPCSNPRSILTVGISVILFWLILAPKLLARIPLGVSVIAVPICPVIPSSCLVAISCLSCVSLCVL